VRVRVESAGEEVHIAVTNDGPAIPSPLAAELFEPFRRGSEPGDGSGLGLGLFIAREIARAHGGTVALRSDDAGTTFTLRLPRSEATPALAGSG
jgi:signal transduction histidine kinase